MAWTHQLTVTYPGTYQPGWDVTGDPSSGSALQAQILARAAELQSQGIASANSSTIDTQSGQICLHVTRNFNSEAAAIDWKNYIDQQFASVVHTSVIQAL